MSRSPATVLSLTFMIQPSGWALPADPNSVWGRMLLPMVHAWSGIEASMEAMLPQVDPRAATTLLPAWEANLGPDPCGRDLAAITQSEQQTLAYQRLTTRGGQSIPYFISVAAALGVSVSIVEGSWCRFGQKRFGRERFSAAGNQFNWCVNMPSAVPTLVQRRFGVARFDDPFGSFTQSPAQCPIGHAAPAHTIVTFNYTGTPMTGAVPSP